MIERYQTKEMSDLWSDEKKFSMWLEVELAVCKAWTEHGEIPSDAYDDIVAKAAFDVHRIEEIENEVKHDMIAFVSCVAEHVGESGRYIHLGLTSSDVIDTASSLVLRRSLDVLIDAIESLRKIIGELALSYRYVPTVGRTHGIHAEPTSVGLKFLNHYSEFGRDVERLKHARDDISVGKISGAVGTYANCPPHIEERVCQLLDLTPDPVSTQIIQRDRHAEVMTAIAIFGGSAERLATEIRHLQRTEVLEMLEPFSAKQKGSSAMPHKKNPILCERICGMARLLRAYSSAALEDIALWHERDISHSSTERVIWPDAFNLAHHMTLDLSKIMRGLNINRENIEANLNLTKGLLFSGRVLIALVEQGLSREDAYKIVQDDAMECWDAGKNSPGLLEILKRDERLGGISREVLESLFDMGYYLKYVDDIFARFTELGK